MLALFPNKLTADGNYFRSETEDFWQQYQMQKFQKPKTFPDFSFDFWNLHEILSVLKKAVSLMV